MYVFLSLLLTAVFICLTVAGETKRLKVRPRVLFGVNFAFAVGGLLTVCITYLIARSQIYGGSFDEAFTEWAWDMFAVYFQISLPVLAVLVVIAAVSFLVAVFDPKQRAGMPMKLRLSVTIVFSVVMLMLAPMYSFMTVNDNVPIDVYVLATGVGEAFLMRAPVLIEYGMRVAAQKHEFHVTSV